LVEVRIVPIGVEPMVGLASRNGSIESRRTRAEDLAVVVADTARQEERLELQRSHLLDFQGRKDLAVGDMISLAHELASVESQMAELHRTADSLQRRIETNLLTLDLGMDRSATRWPGIGDSFSDFLDSFADGTSEMIGTPAFGFPFVIVLFPLALVWRWLWCKATARRDTSVT